MAFGERLQEVRKRSGLTQEEFAEQLQVSRQSVSRWESGRGYPEMEKIIFICNRYGVTMDGLFKEEVPTPGEPPVEAPLLSARTLGSELSNLYANLSPYNKSIGIMLLTVIAMIGPAYVYCMRSLKGGADEMMTIIWIAAIIIFWNTMKLGEVVANQKRDGKLLSPDLLAHVSPLGWEHINLTGEYRWPKP
jgi:transcriptional regulator with XRE-family HTH domain